MLTSHHTPSITLKGTYFEDVVDNELCTRVHTSEYSKNQHNETLQIYDCFFYHGPDLHKN